MTSRSVVDRRRSVARTARRVLVCAAVLATWRDAHGALAQPAAPGAEEVSVRAAPRARSAGDVTVSVAEGRAGAGTEGDPAKIVYDLPGVARSAFESGKLIVWGAAPEDTRIYVDGIEIPQLFHGSAIRSTVNGDLLQRVTMTPGAYGADYGHGIGGILRVETRQLPASGLHGYLAADALDGSAMVSGAAGDRVRVAIAGRYGWIDRVLGAVSAPDVGNYFAIPRYGDYQAKVQLAWREEESFDAVVLGSADDLTRVVPDVAPSRVRSETARSSFQRAYLRYRRRLDDGSEIDVAPWIGQDTSHRDQRFGAIPAQLDQHSWRWGLRASHRSQAAPRVDLGFGLDVDGSDARIARNGSMTIPSREGDITVFGQRPGDDTNADTWDATVIDVAPHAQIDVGLGALALSAGLRLDAVLLEASRQTPRVGETPSIGLSHLEGEVQPRLAGHLRVSPHLSVFAAAGLYAQPPASSDRSAVFGTPSLGLERAQHASVGETLELTDTLSADVTMFYKWMTDLAVRDPSSTPRLAQALLQNGVGRSYGVQLLIRQRAWHGFSGWVAYTISRSERRDRPGANWRLFDYDQTHVLTILGSQAIGAWTVGLRVRYARGLPRTPVAGALFDTRDDVFEPIFGAQNSIRLPDFWQLDVRLDRRFVLGESTALVVYFEGLNVTDRANGEEYVYSADFSRRAAITGLPAVAMLGVRIER